MSRAPRLDGHAAGLCALGDPAWRRKLWRLGLWLCVPVLGWPALLGYRGRFARGLMGPAPSRLPDEHGARGFVRCAGDGLRAMLVVQGYLAPLWVALVALCVQRGWRPDAFDARATALVLVAPILSPFAFPVACVLAVAGADARLAPVEAASLLVAFALTVFVLPAGFLEVSRTGRYRSAFALGRTLPFVGRNLAGYVEAWLSSLALSMAGTLFLPLAPWGIAWSYLGIVVLFNTLLLRDDDGPRAPALRHLLASGRSVHGRVGFTQVTDGGGEPVTVVDLGHFSAPWPGRRRRGQLL